MGLILDAMQLLNDLRHIRERRARLRTLFSVSANFEALEETCLPSYCHGNFVAAYAAWWRLFAAARLARTHVPDGPVLDFGATAGELRHLLPAQLQYDFVEQNERLVDHVATLPGARRTDLGSIADSRYAAVFALDSLEHYRDWEEILGRLAEALRDDGVLIMSGQTENALYRAGRRISGFHSHYHVTNVWRIERAATARLNMVAAHTGPWGIPLFSVTAWRKQDAVG